MKKFLVKVFTWISENIVCEQAMYEALYNDRIKPLIDKILCKDEKIARLETELLDVKKELEIKRAEAPKPKRKYNKKKKSDDKA
jgi:hypothetical protein